MMKTGVQSKKPPRQLTTCTSALMRPEQLNATNKVFVVKKTVVRSYTIGMDLNGNCVISESPELVTQKTTIKDLYDTFSSDSTYSNPLVHPLGGPCRACFLKFEKNEICEAVVFLLFF